MSGPPAVPSRQDSDPFSMSDFWRELENIQQARGSDAEEGSPPEPRTPEEGEAEADWLQDTGLSTLIGDQTPPADHVLLLSTLTPTQAAAVQRRVDHYSRSVRKRCKHPARDVRDVFKRAGIYESLPEENGTEQKVRHLAPTAPGNTPKSAPSASSNALPVNEEVFDTDAAYSEQAAARLKGWEAQEGSRTEKPGPLPKFQIRKGRLGVTRISDLSPPDMKQVPTLALIELTALCDVLDIELKRNKAGKRKATESRLFGVTLGALLDHDQKLIPDTRVPLILQAILACLEKNGLEKQGILRVSGSQARIKTLQQRLERDFYAGLFSWDDVPPHDAAGLLKLLLRELPAPLITAEYLPAFTAVQNIPDLKQRLQALNLLTLILPEPNRCTLKALLEFLCKVASREQCNRMSLWNVATVMAPNLFLYRGAPSKGLDGGEKQQAERAAGVVRAMVHYQDLLWTVPAFLVSQVRKLNENGSKKYPFPDRKLRNFLRKIHTDKERAEKIQSEPCKQVTVRSSLFLKESLTVPLDEGTRAADVLRQFQKCLRHHSWHMVSTVGLLQCNGSFGYPNLELFEVGGNICEHCLDPDTYLLDLYNINPTGEWVIKPRRSSLPVL
ncbi:rho GTPase-activating protein 40 isoform X2 [Ascaphus truei]